MSMPSDTNADVTEAMERVERPEPPRRDQLTSEQVGWAAAALVAFLGIAYGGPALARWQRRPPLKERLSRRARETRDLARKRADQARRKLRKQGRRLGGGSIWR